VEQGEGELKGSGQNFRALLGSAATTFAHNAPILTTT